MVRTPDSTKIGYGVLCGSDPRENFSEKKLISEKSAPGAAL